MGEVKKAEAILVGGRGELVVVVLIGDLVWGILLV